MAEAGLEHEDGTPVTISIGVAVVEHGPLEIAEVMQRADEALYRAKDAGKDCVALHEPHADPDRDTLPEPS